MNNTTGAQTRCGAVRCDAQRCDANRIIVSLSIVQFGESRVPGLGLGTEEEEEEDILAERATTHEARAEMPESNFIPGAGPLGGGFVPLVLMHLRTYARTSVLAQSGNNVLQPWSVCIF
jgi:hypothetical protein